jgi:hypothetical protein
MRLHLSGLLALAVLTSSGSSLAAEATRPYAECTHEASEADLTAAKAAFQAGNVSFNEADYPRAILYWEDAFRRDCTAHPLLLNLARAYELNGQKQQAVVALETFLQREPNTAEKAQIQRRIEVLKKQLEAEQAAVPVAAPPPPTTTTPAQQPPPQQVTLKDHPKSNQVLPLVVAGAGAVIFVVGGLVYLDGASKVKEYEDQCGTSHKACPPGVEEPANAAAKKETTGGVIALVGLPVLAGGLIWFFVAGSSSKSAVVTPAVGPGYAGLALNGAF